MQPDPETEAGVALGFVEAPGLPLQLLLDLPSERSLAQAYYVASGRNTLVVPEIYDHSMAHQWARLAKSGCVITRRCASPVS